MVLSIMRPVLLMRSPSELSGLLALLNVAFDRPGVNELLQTERKSRQESEDKGETATSALLTQCASEDCAMLRVFCTNLVMLDDGSRSLCVALRNMDGLDLKVLRELCPLLARLRYGMLESSVACNVQQTLLDEVRHETGVGTVGDQSGRTVLGELLAELESP